MQAKKDVNSSFLKITRMDLPAEKLNLIQQILMLDEAAFGDLQRLVVAQGFIRKAVPVNQLISDQELEVQFHEARRQAAAGETYSTADVRQMVR